MLKKNVFLVSVRRVDAQGVPHGEIEEKVVCSADEASLRTMFQKKMPGVHIVALTNLQKLEERAKKILGVLKGTDTSWPVLIDPALAL